MNQPVVSMPSALPAPLEVIVKGKGNTVAYACSKCGQLFIFRKDEDAESRRAKFEEAAAHCVRQCVCGKPLDYHYSLRCASCRAELEGAKERVRFERSKKLSIENYPNDPVFWPDQPGGDMKVDGYFSSVDALLDFAEDGGLELPEYVWACTRVALVLNAESILGTALEEQDMDPESVSITTPAGLQLQSFLDAWVKEQGIHAWFYDSTRAVLLREPSA